MSKKTGILTVVALCMLVLVVLDNGGFESDSSKGVTSKDVSSVKITRLMKVIKAEASITRVYAQLAPIYAEQVAFMDTVSETDDTTEVAVDKFVSRQAESYGIEVKHLNVGKPLFLAEGVFWVLVDVEFLSYSSQATNNALLGFADAQRGTAWKSFRYRAIEDEKKLLLSGQLAILYVRAIE